MRVVLSLAEGQDSQKFWLRQNQVARFGSTEWADFTVHDPHMSGVHFLINVTADSCILRDLNSRNGTLVNGEPVRQQRRLQDGDLIMAGKTLFSVRLHGHIAAVSGDTVVSSRITRTSNPPYAAVPTPHADPLSPSHIPEMPQLPYVRNRLESGLSIFRPICAEAKPTDMAHLLTKDRRGFFVVNMSAFTKSSLPFTLSRGVVMLNDEIGLVEATEDAERLDLFKTSWGKDATIFVATNAETSHVVTQLQSVVSAFYHPSVLRTQLLTAPRVYVTKLLSLFDAVMFERQDGAGWELYSLVDAEDDWKYLAFPNPPLQTEAASTEIDANRARIA